MEAIVGMKYVPPLGGPYMSASAGASMEDTSLAGALFDTLLPDGKDELTAKAMSKSLTKLADGDEGLTWAAFQRVVESSVAQQEEGGDQ